MTRNTANIAVLQPQPCLIPLELATAITSHHNLPDLFHDLAGRLHHLFDFRYLGVVLREGSRNVLRLHLLETSEPAWQQTPAEIPLEGSISGWVWQHQQPLVIRDLEQETRFPVTKTLLDHRAKSVCSLPLTTAHQRLGVLSMASDKLGAYDQLNLELAQLVAAQIAVAVEAQDQQHQLERERDHLRLLLEVNNILVSTLDLRELLGAISTSLRRVLEHDYASLALYDPESNQLRLQALEFAEGEGLIEEGLSIPLEGTPSGLAFTSRQPVLVNHLSLEQFPSEITRRLIGEGLKSGCSLPLISPGRVSGVLNVASLREHAFTPADAELLGEIAKQLAIAVENALSFHQIVELYNKLADEKLYLEDEIRTAYKFEEVVGESAALKRALQDVETVAPLDATVLIYGETGTGKELIARAIHNLSPRRDRTLVKVNCAAIPTGLLESELFGHEKGAFTGAISQKLGRLELAHQGTLFLDEVGDIPLELQPKLLRALQEQEFERLGSTRTVRVDVRLVAATHRDLAQMVADGRFRSDLYYRLNVFPVLLPPLRERSEDIPMLARHFTQRFARRMGRQIEAIPTKIMEALVRYPWPGNIRELQNVIERAVILSPGPALQIPLEDLQPEGSLAEASAGRALTLAEVEREHIQGVLRETGWVLGGAKGAAARLGMKRSTLQWKMKQLGISRPA